MKSRGRALHVGGYSRWSSLEDSAFAGSECFESIQSGPVRSDKRNDFLQICIPQRETHSAMSGRRPTTESQSSISGLPTKKSISYSRSILASMLASTLRWNDFRNWPDVAWWKTPWTTPNARGIKDIDTSQKRRVSKPEYVSNFIYCRPKKSI